MESLFPEPISSEYVASTSHEFRNESSTGRSETITNLPVSSASISHEIPSRIQRDRPIENIIGSLEDGVQTRNQSGAV
ncbi:hypothetical protein E9993_23170, partial [Labilibacter sediminis]